MSCKTLVEDDVRCRPPYSKTGTSYLPAGKSARFRRSLRAKICKSCAGANEYTYIGDLRRILDYVDSSKATLMGPTTLEEEVDFRINTARARMELRKEQKREDARMAKLVVQQALAENALRASRQQPVPRGYLAAGRSRPRSPRRVNKKRSKQARRRSKGRK